MNYHIVVYPKTHLSPSLAPKISTALKPILRMVLKNPSTTNGQTMFYMEQKDDSTLKHRHWRQ